MDRSQTTRERFDTTATVLAPEAETVRVPCDSDGQCKTSEGLWEIDGFAITGSDLVFPGPFGETFKPSFFFHVELNKPGIKILDRWEYMTVEYDGQSYIEVTHVMKWWMIMFTLSNIKCTENAQS